MARVLCEHCLKLIEIPIRIKYIEYVHCSLECLIAEYHFRRKFGGTKRKVITVVYDDRVTKLSTMFFKGKGETDEIAKH